MAPGGFAPQAEEAYAESIRWPGIKIVEEGELIEDIHRLHNANVRIPVRVFNDVRALIAANNRCDRRLTSTIEEFGLDTFKHYQSVNKDLTKGAVKSRIQNLPDGSYSTTQWVEHDGKQNKLYNVEISLTVDDNKLTVDFSGSAEQAPGFINVSEAGTVGITMTPVMLMLCPDIPVNEGMFESVDVITEEGTVVNPTMPAPVGSGHIETGAEVSKGVTTLLSRVMNGSDSEFIRDHAMAPFLDAWSVGIFYGENQFGDPDVFLDMNGGSAGGGAQSVSDGLDCTGMFGQLQNGLPDIEINESEHPLLYLWRELNLNSGGPGEYRGGMGMDFAWTLHDVSGGQETVTTACTQVPTSGVSGGYPGDTSVWRTKKDSDINSTLKEGDIPDGYDNIEGENKELPAKRAGIKLDEDTVFRYSVGGGSGFGDPLLRDPDKVLSDVQDGYISKGAAKDTYGVIITADLEVDETATTEARGSIREERQNWSVEQKFDEGVADTSKVTRFNRNVTVVRAKGDKYLECRNCETVFAPFVSFDSQEWLSYTAKNDSPLAQRLADLSVFAQKREDDPDIRLREHCCPSCGTLFQTEVASAEEVAE
jgi:N-methylhydantoinase B